MATPSASSWPPAFADVAPPPAAPGPEADGGEDWRAGGFGIYVHWPFCAAKCPYCDFNSHVRGHIAEDRWRAALVAEVARLAAELPGRRVDSIFFGGGTPSLMAPATVAAVLEAIARGWRLAADAEVTLEANPTSAEAARFRGYAAAGVNRLSLGIQALDDGDLRRLGRLHTAAEALAALETARAIFPRVSFDLIYARQEQSPAAWEAELRRALALGPEHVSLYQLTIEPGTRFFAARARGGLRGLPDPDVAAELFHLTQAVTAEAGLSAYEVSNHAVAGAESRHNLVYWRYGDYAGIGPGAHGRLSVGGRRQAVAAWRSPETWLAAVEDRGSGEARREELDRPEQALEMLMMGLRLAEGIDIARHARLAGRPLAAPAVATLRAEGLIRTEAGRLQVTAEGRAVLDAILRVLASSD